MSYISDIYNFVLKIPYKELPLCINIAPKSFNDFVEKTVSDADTYDKDMDDEYRIRAKDYFFKFVKDRLQIGQN